MGQQGTVPVEFSEWERGEEGFEQERVRVTTKPGRASTELPFAQHSSEGKLRFCRTLRSPRAAASQLRHHGGRQEDQEGAGVYQQQAGPGDEVRQVHLGLHHHAQVAARWQGQARHHRQQLPASTQV